MAYAYDVADRRTSATLTGQSAVSYAYDAADRLTSIAEAGTTVAFTYDNAGRRLTATLPNDVDAAYAYDDSGQLTAIGYAIGATSLGTLAYTYDAAGHRSSVGGTLARVSLPAAVGSTTYNAANQLTAWGSASPTYDLNGNMTADGTNTFTWNARNQLLGIDAAATPVAAYAYDAFGGRTQKTLASTTTGFAYDGANFVEEQDGNGDPTAAVLTGGIDQTFGRTGTDTTAFLVDALGSTVALVDEAGDIATNYTYEPFGLTTTSGNTSTNAAQYTGRENDGSLYYYRARFYNPALGRFISEDPLGFGGGDTNLYAYVGDDPVNATDPSGLCGPACILAAGCVIGGFLAAATYLGPGHEFLGQRKATWGGLLGSATGGCGAGLAAGWAWMAFGPAAAAAAPAIVSGGGAAAVRLGQAGEAAVRAAYQIGDKVKIVVAGRERIPDGLLEGVISEVKNVQTLNLTQQLRDYAQYAAEAEKGMRFDLYVKQGASLSGPLKAAIAEGRINLILIPQ